MTKKKADKTKTTDKDNKGAKKAQKLVKEKTEEAKKQAKEVLETLEDSAEEIEENLRKAGDQIPDSSFWEETSENISEGAKIVGEETRNIAEKISAYSEVLFGKVKDKSSEAFKTGLDLTREGVNKAQSAADELKDNFEVARLNRRKKELAAQLGMKFYLEIKNNDNKVPENILRKRVFMSLLKELENIDKQILKLKDE